MTEKLGDNGKLRTDNKETFPVTMPNTADMPANYRKVNNEQDKTKH